MIRRGAGIAVGGGLIAVGLAAVITAVLAPPFPNAYAFAFLFGSLLALVGGRIIGRALGLGKPAQPE
ncbi:hypothetical protein ACIBPB_28155 [Micromonospora sp. NPDC049836]|uniref:hypothetical protein n=1 Tax=Micromonospora sp. NPDC049836 TaxID=3364274 RepID=UPI00379E2EFA